MSGEAGHSLSSVLALSREVETSFSNHNQVSEEKKTRNNRGDVCECMGAYMSVCAQKQKSRFWEFSEKIIYSSISV